MTPDPLRTAIERIGIEKPSDYSLVLEEVERMSDGFQYKTYRCEWVAEVYEVDQYGMRAKDAEVWYESAWPTRDEALSALDRRLEPEPENPNRRGRYPEAKHGYYNADVRYREVLVP